MKKLSFEEFVNRSKAIHGDKYDYSKVNYVDIKTKVCIICKEHGEFLQTPDNHLAGRGCPVCRYISSKKKNTCTTEEFIKKAKSIHGDKYDYSKTIYTGTLNKVCIICPKHGEFFIKPDSHLNKKAGCPYCSHHYTRSNEEFITDAKKIHGDKYDYSKVNYIGSHIKVCIICPKHGEFWQTPHDHLRGNGCPSCNSSKIENEIEELLKKYSISYIKEYNEKIFGKQELDFLIKEKNIVIECQGIQHFKPVRFGGKDEETTYKNFLHTIELDERKKNICESIGFKILYYTKKNNTVRGYKKDDIFRGIYNNENVFFDKKKILKKIIEEL